jgi:preprotein translocase SecE subunit
MAEKKQTVRERTQASDKQPKERRAKRTVRVAAKPLTTAGRGVKKVAKPFSFLLWPFKTRPVRFIGRILATVLFINYFRSSWQELRQVSWPNRRETVRLTIAVFIFAIVFGLAVALVDFGLDKIFHKILLK